MADPIAHHPTMRLVDDRGIARTPAILRQASRIIFHHGDARGLLGFRVADTHVHALVAASRPEAGRFALFTEAGLRKGLRIPVPFERVRIRPIHTERHLGNALRYVFKQEEHHGTAFDLAHDGSSLPDLLGMRVLGVAIAERVKRMLPRLARLTLLGWFDAGNFEKTAQDIDLLAEAAAATVGLDSLVGGTHSHHAARRAAVHLLDAVAPQARPASDLGISRRSVSRYRAEPSEPAILRAMDLQLRLRTALRDRARAGFDGERGPVWIAPMPVKSR